MLSIKEHLNKIETQLKDIKSNLKKSDIHKVQLTIAINFVFSKDNDEEHVIHLKRTNIKIMINDKADEVFFNHFFLDIKLSWKLY